MNTDYEDFPGFLAVRAFERIVNIFFYKRFFI